jgi:O-antigen chain-terminating methyltransferase
MTDGFYRAFEERWRGSRDLVKSRLHVYLRFVAPLMGLHPDAKAIDLGCGRGEWLELLKETGIDAQGVDLDDGMLAACRQLGLKVQTQDAIVFLKSIPDASQAVVSGFHIIEHLPFDSLQELVKETLRVLKPGGLLILETPNPENLVVGTSAFYLDPTHQRPIPPQLLEFLTEYAGFKRSKIMRLQESPELATTPEITLLGVLNGASPDYAVVAQKNGPEELFVELQAAFDAEYGLTMEMLANRFQDQAEARAMQAEARATQAEARATQAEVRANSSLRRITAPLCWLAGLVRRITTKVLSSK